MVLVGSSCLFQCFSSVSLDWGRGAWMSCPFHPFLRFPFASFDVPSIYEEDLKSNEAIRPNMPVAIGFLGTEVWFKYVLNCFTFHCMSINRYLSRSIHLSIHPIHPTHPIYPIYLIYPIYPILSYFILSHLPQTYLAIHPWIYVSLSLSLFLFLFSPFSCFFFLALYI